MQRRQNKKKYMTYTIQVSHKYKDNVCDLSLRHMYIIMVM